MFYAPIDPYTFEKFRSHRPPFWTCAGRREAKFKKAEISKRNGMPLGYYDIVVRNPVTHNIETTTVLYGMRNGVIYKIKDFPTRVSYR